MVDLKKKINLHNLVGVNKKDDIHSILISCAKEKQQILFWQLHNMERNKFTASITEIDKGLEQVIFKINGVTPTLDEQLALFMYEEKKGFVSKSDLFFLKNDTLLIGTPDEIKLTELRKHTRFDLSHIKNRLVYHSKKMGLGEKVKHFTSRISDVSQWGMSLEIHQHQIGRYAMGDELAIKEIASIPMGDLKGTIVYSSPFYNHPEGKNIIKAGIVFDRMVDKELIKDIFLNQGSDDLIAA